MIPNRFFRKGIRKSLIYYMKTKRVSISNIHLVTSDSSLRSDFFEKPKIKSFNFDLMIFKILSNSSYDREAYREYSEKLFNTLYRV